MYYTKREKSRRFEFTKTSDEMEKCIFTKSQSREEYLSLVARLILHMREKYPQAGAEGESPLKKRRSGASYGQKVNGQTTLDIGRHCPMNILRTLCFDRHQTWYTEDHPPAMITSSPFGNHEGKEVLEYTLKNSKGTEIHILNYGGIIRKIVVPDKNGKMDDICLGFDGMEGYAENPPYLGALIGRYANRIAEGRFTIDGKTYQLDTNNEPNALHGGKVGFDKRVWESKIDGDVLQLTYVSADGEEKYPGEVKVTVRYQLTDDNELVIQYSATTSAKTVINLTNHAYFNLGGQVSGDIGNIFDHNVTITADKYTPVDEVSIPTGVIADVDKTPWDLRTMKNLGEMIPTVPGDVGYDHNFCFGKTGWRKYMARVEHPASGRFLEMYSTEPGVQFYTAYYLNATGKGGASYKKFDAFCLEAQHYPDSPNKPNFPTTLLAPSDTYLQTTSYKFGVM
ncbi:galactose mutarotase-like isoform X3 [Ostrea edulis]|uniref:galactose mutarotase-like isoform X3 n=1 Tax=Ostrea edulis TaxID=37623 RepID=UPI0024AFE1B6|nr:galactose mutarotase-like isoform X3 [Ostrea edulis]